jgi:hypothetical protein
VELVRAPGVQSGTSTSRIWDATGPAGRSKSSGWHVRERRRLGDTWTGGQVPKLKKAGEKIERGDGIVWVGSFHLWVTNREGERLRRKKEKVLGPAASPAISANREPGRR